MQVIFYATGTLTLIREDNDPKFYGMQHAAGEHRLLRHLQRLLVEAGFDVIKKRAQKDGHMIGDEYQPYIRTKSHRSQGPHIMIWSGFYALKGAHEDWNKGTASLLVEGDAFERNQDTVSLIRDLCEKHEKLSFVY